MCCRSEHLSRLSYLSLLSLELCIQRNVIGVFKTVTSRQVGFFLRGGQLFFMSSKFFTDYI